MIREWPQSVSDDVTARWPKNFSLLVLVGIFATIMSILIPGLIYLYVAGKMPEEIGLLSFLVLMFFVGLFGVACIGGFVSSVKNYRNPFLRFLANSDGLFMNITFQMKDAFFVSWSDIEKIEKTIVKRSMGSGGTQHVDSLGIFIKNESNIVLPKVMRGVEDCTKNQVNFPEDTLNKDLDGLLAKLNSLKDGIS